MGEVGGTEGLEVGGNNLAWSGDSFSKLLYSLLTFLITATLCAELQQQ